MIIHFSILGVILLVCGLWEHGTKRNRIRFDTYKMPIAPFFIIFGYIAFLAAMRSGMNDTSTYINSFDNLPGTLEDIQRILLSDGKDKGFDILANLFKLLISDNYHMWFGFFAIVESLCIVYILRRESLSILVSSFYFFTSTLYYNYFSMMRQWFAVCVFFYAFRWIKSRKFFPYLICCLLIAQIHASAYICIPVYFLVTGKPWSKKQLTLICGIVVALIYLNPILSALENTDSTYDYVFSTMAANTGSSPVRIAIAAVPIILCLLYKKRIENENNVTLNICINMSLLNLLLTIVATFTSGLYLIRFSIYFNMFNILLFPILLEKILRGDDKKLMKFGFYVFYFPFYVYQMQHQGAFGYSSDILGVF